MRQWCQGKDAEVRLRAAQCIAEAVHFLHVHVVLHGDLKHSNVVFDSDGAMAMPVMCDFCLGVNMHENGINADAPHAAQPRALRRVGRH